MSGWPSLRACPSVFSVLHSQYFLDYSLRKLNKGDHDENSSMNDLTTCHVSSVAFSSHPVKLHDSLWTAVAHGLHSRTLPLAVPVPLPLHDPLFVNSFIHSPTIAYSSPFLPLLGVVTDRSLFFGRICCRCYGIWHSAGLQRETAGKAKWRKGTRLLPLQQQQRRQHT